MTKNEINFKTAFCCIACDREIAKDEIALLKKLSEDTGSFYGVDIETTINRYVSEINEIGSAFISNHLLDIESEFFTTEEQLELIDIAIKAIEADSKVLYEEISFFKRLRDKLPITDAEILFMYKGKPEIEEYLIEDIPTQDEPCNVQFDFIDFSKA